MRIEPNVESRLPCICLLEVLTLLLNASDTSPSQKQDMILDGFLVCLRIMIPMFLERTNTYYI